MQAPLLLRVGRRLLPLLLGACLVATTAQAQLKNLPDPIKFGQIDNKDLTAAPFVADSAAAAVVLCDYGRSRMEGHREGFQVVFERVTRIKILKKSGYDEATVEIPLYHRDENREKVSNLRGFTYNLVNGAVEKTKLEPSGAFLEKRTANVDVQKFTLPGVREGSVIEYAYTLRSDFVFNFQDWTFQHTVPVRWSEYRVSIPTFYKYKIVYQGYRPLDVDKPSMGQTGMNVEQKVTTTNITRTLSISTPTEDHQWVLKDVPAFREESYMTTADDYLARLDFQLAGEQWREGEYEDLTDTWPKINHRLMLDESFGQQLDRGNFLKDQMRALALLHADAATRAAAVREIVMASVRYDGTNRYSSDNSLRKAYDAHRGTSADVNLLLIAALRDAGLTAEPVLLSTRDHGRVDKQFPMLSKFNYVVALVPLPDGKELLVDATEPLLPCGVLPERCLNQTGRLIPSDKNAEGRWVDLAPTLRHVSFRQVALTLDAQGGLKGKAHEERGGYSAADGRETLAAEGEKKFLASVAKRHEAWTIAKATLGQVDDVSKPLTLDYEFSQPAEDKTALGTIYLSPLSDFSVSQNPFRRESRSYAIDMGVAEEETVMVALTLPEGYELAEVPKPAVVDLPNGGGRFVYSVAATAPGVVQLTSRLSLRNTVYPAEQYTGLRELYRILLARHSEKLIVQKKPGS